jgi:proteasome assembly chaperone (PAC2) family protein
MNQTKPLIHPWLVAVWPGMGHVALNAGVYLLAKLNMSLIAEFGSSDLFDVDQVEVKDGIIQHGWRPRHRAFAWRDPHGKNDLIVFLGEAQPPIGKFIFCNQLIDFARRQGVERVFTFAAMATQMRPEHLSQVFVAATDADVLDTLPHPEIQLLRSGNIGGLNGVLLAAAAEQKLTGACLLGEMPQIFAQFPFPKASLAILEVFTTIAGIELDFAELTELVHSTADQLSELMVQAEEGLQKQFSGFEEVKETESTEETKLNATDRKRIERLFEQAASDRAKAFVLKQELDRLGVFRDFEDRFLDLFKKTSTD